MLRTGRSLPPMRLSTLRFDARRFHPTPAVCYRAPWRLPGPDFHRLADASLRLRDHLPILTTSFLIACQLGTLCTSSPAHLSCTTSMATTSC